MPRHANDERETVGLETSVVSCGRKQNVSQNNCQHQTNGTELANIWCHRFKQNALKTELVRQQKHLLFLYKHDYETTLRELDYVTMKM